MTRTYDELCLIKSFEDRFAYLNLQGSVGKDTFGFDRYLNQSLYRSKEWKRTRDIVIARDDGCDMGLKDHPIFGRIVIHHMNPLSIADIENGNPDIFNPRFLICVSYDTHNAIHYGDIELIRRDEVVIRRPNDTCPWKE